MMADTMLDEIPSVLLPCSTCSRTFRPDVLERHIKVCEKAASKKRKVFDSFKSRVSGTELEEFLGPAPLPGQSPKRPDKSPVKKPRGTPKWKETHENLIAVLRAARGATVADPQATLNKNAGNEQCPSCGRFFGPRAFDRHVQFCKEKTSRIKMTPSKVSQAQERLEARTKYKAPLSLKPKLTTKEKYSPMLPRKAETSDVCSLPQTAKSFNSISKNAKTKSALSNLTRQSPTRSSERQRSVSPKKPFNSNSKVLKESYGKHLTPPKIKDNLKDNENLRPRTGMNISTEREKIRNSSRKISDCEDDSPNSKQKHSYREKPRRKSCLSSDDGNDTDTTNLSINSNISHREKLLKKEVKESHHKSTNIQSRVSSPMDTIRKSKRLSPLINDLSVNDESFGIYVAPCSQQQKSRTSWNDSGAVQMKERKEREVELNKEERAKCIVLPNMSTNRLSKIPKPVFKGQEIKEEINHDDEVNDESAESISRKDRERTAIIKKDNLQKQSDTLDSGIKDLIHMENDFDIASTLGNFKMRDSMETERNDAKRLSQSGLWDMKVEKLVKLDDSTECKANVLDSILVNNKEDEFVVLHLTEPEKLVDNDDVHAKISISEPCFKMDYSSKSSISGVMTKSSNIFVFNAKSQCMKKRKLLQKRHKMRKIKEVKIVPRISTIRERTFLASDNPKIKRRKLSGKHVEELTNIKISSDYFFGIRKECRKFGKKPTDGFDKEKEKMPKRNCGKNNMAERMEKKSRKMEERDVEEVDESFHIGRTEKYAKSKEKRNKTYEYFEIGRDHDQEELFSESKTYLQYREEEEEEKQERETKNFRNFEAKEVDSELRRGLLVDKESISKSKSSFQFDEETRKAEKETFMENKGMCKERKKSVKSKNGRNFMLTEETELTSKKCICYSDEEFEELRLKKEERFIHPKPKGPHRQKNFPVSNADGIYVKGENISTIKSLSLAHVNNLGNIAEEEEHGERIQIENFIVEKPSKMSILSRSNNCLEKLFPKLPKTTKLKSSESSTAVSLGYVMNSIYDLRDEENLSGKMLKKRADKRIRLPEIGTVTNKINQNENSMSSLLQTWKIRKETMRSKMNVDVKLQEMKKSNICQIALLPYVLTQKLVEVAGQFNNKKSNDEGYDPFKQAERQMLALLSWPSIADLKSTNEKSKSPSYSPNCNINLETSPTSAFCRYPVKDEKMPKDAKESANQKVLNSTGRLVQSGNKSRDKEYTPTYAAADDWEEIFEKHFDVNRNEMSDKMTRSVKSALDGLLKSTPKKLSSSSLDNSSSPRKNRSDTSENSVVDEIVYTSTPKRSPSRLSNSSDTNFDVSGQKNPNCDRKRSVSHGRLTPPDDFSDSIINKDDRDRKSNRNSGVSLSSLSFCSQASDTTLADDEIMKTNLEIIGVGRGSPRGSKRRFARSQSVFDERNKMLFSKTFEHNFSSSDENEILPVINGKQGKTSMLSNPFPKSIPSRFPRSHSAMDDRCRGDGNFSEGRDQASSPEGSKNRKAKMSGDSAYSSLNRRSPRPGSQTNAQEDRLSSSGSEHSLPPLSNDTALKPRSLNFDNISSTKDQPYKMSKFCHECGSKYPVPVAKFCCECGVRRLII